MNGEMTKLLAARLGFSPEELPNRIAERFSDPLLGSLFTSMFEKASEPPEEDLSPPHVLPQADRIIEKLQQDLAAADTMARYIADIFGACATCWGLNRVCPQCRGNGKPGSREPQVEEMLSWVEPALARSGLKVTGIP